ncbi:MAG: hypothetical protein WC538_20425 [Thermoanaerobaculia bacterium]|jgi:hypothetical protein
MPAYALNDRFLQRQQLDVSDDDAPWVVLLFVFEGDAAAWLSFLEQQGSRSQRRDDLPLARAVARWCDDNESLRLRLRALAERLRSGAN